MSDYYQTVRSAVGRVLRSMGWHRQIDRELTRLASKIADPAAGVDLTNLGELLSSSFVKANDVDRRRASVVLASAGDELRRPAADLPSIHLSNVTIHNIGGNISLGSRDVSQSVVDVTAGDLESLRRALAGAGLAPSDVSAFLEIAESTPVLDRQAQIKSPDGALRKVASRVASAYLASAMALPVDICVGLLVNMMSAFWGMG